MATYKYSNHLAQSKSDAFDAIHSPGVDAPFAGVYRCTGCGWEIGIAHGHKLPPASHHTHTASVKWKLLVYAQHKKQ